MIAGIRESMGLAQDSAACRMGQNSSQVTGVVSSQLMPPDSTSPVASPLSPSIETPPVEQKSRKRKAAKIEGGTVSPDGLLDAKRRKRGKQGRRAGTEGEGTIDAIDSATQDSIASAEKRKKNSKSEEIEPTDLAGDSENNRNGGRSISQKREKSIQVNASQPEPSRLEAKKKSGAEERIPGTPSSQGLKNGRIPTSALSQIQGEPYHGPTSRKKTSKPANSTRGTHLPTPEPEVKSQKQTEQGQKRKREPKNTGQGALRELAPKGKSTQAEAAKVSASPKPKAAQQRQDDSSAPAKGPYTDKEQKIVQSIFEKVMDECNLSDAELRAKIKIWASAGTFKTELQEALPNRKKQSIRQFCQNRYHSYQRGPWTSDQDESLRKAHAAMPGLWAKISDVVDRDPQACKDRWRNHLQYNEDLQSGPWSQQEEQQLLSAVEECIELIKDGGDEEISHRESLDDLINWAIISQKLSGKRSAARCRLKYAKLKSRLEKDGSGVEHSTSKQAEIESQRERHASRQIFYFEVGDYYDCFTEIHTAFDDHSQHFNHETNVVWSMVALKNPDSRFNSTYGGGILRRTALHHAMTQWTHDAKKVRHLLEKAETIPAKAFVLANWIEKKASVPSEELKRTFRVELIGKPIKEHEKILPSKGKQARQSLRGAQSKRILSKETVDDSDDDNDDDRGVEEGEPRDDSEAAAEEDAEDDDTGEDVDRNAKRDGEDDEDDTERDADDVEETIGPGASAKMPNGANNTVESDAEDEDDDDDDDDQDEDDAAEEKESSIDSDSDDQPAAILSPTLSDPGQSSTFTPINKSSPKPSTGAKNRLAPSGNHSEDDSDDGSTTDSSTESESESDSDSSD